MIYIVLVNWQRYDDTVECLESLMRLDGPAFRVLVVDNESSAKGVESLAAWASSKSIASPSGPPWQIGRIGPRLVDPSSFSVLCSLATSINTTIGVVCLLENTGFAHANNVGIRLALQDPDCDFVWLLNNDTVVASDALGQMLTVVNAHPNIGILGSLLLYYDRPGVIQSFGGRFHRLAGAGENIACGRSLDWLNVVADRSDPQYVVGASMIVSRCFLKEIGLLSEEYFLYFEELDWSYRNKGRFRIARTSSAIVYHKEGAAIGTNSRGRPSDTSLYYYNVNLLRFTKKFHARYLPLLAAKIVGRALIYGIFGDRMGAAALFLALKDFVQGRRRRGPIEVSA